MRPTNNAVQPGCSRPSNAAGIRHGLLARVGTRAAPADAAARLTVQALQSSRSARGHLQDRRLRATGRLAQGRLDQDLVSRGKPPHVAGQRVELPVLARFAQGRTAARLAGDPPPAPQRPVRVRDVEGGGDRQRPEVDVDEHEVVGTVRRRPVRHLDDGRHLAALAGDQPAEHLEAGAGRPHAQVDRREGREIPALHGHRGAGRAATRREHRGAGVKRVERLHGGTILPPGRRRVQQDAAARPMV